MSDPIAHFINRWSEFDVIETRSLYVLLMSTSTVTLVTNSLPAEWKLASGPKCSAKIAAVNYCIYILRSEFYLTRSNRYESLRIYNKLKENKNGGDIFKYLL